MCIIFQLKILIISYYFDLMKILKCLKIDIINEFSIEEFELNGNI